MRVAALLPLLCALAGLGCDPAIHSERDDWTLTFPGLQARRTGWPEPHLLLAGSRLCPVLSCKTCPDGQCDDATIRAAGPIVAEDDGCFRAGGPGPIVWTVDPPCVAVGQEPDRAVVEVIAPTAVDPTVVSDLDQLVADKLAAGDGTSVATADGEWLPYPEFPLRLVAEAQARFLVELTTIDDHVVAYDPAIARVDWTTTAGREPVAYPGAAVEAVTFAGTEASTQLTVADRTWPLGPVLGVSPERAASLDLTAAIGPDGPAYARAVVRDGDGEVLHGAPVTWSVDDHALAIGLDVPNLDHVALADCRPPEQRGGSRVAALRARWRGLSAALILRWEGVAGEPDPNWSPDDSCSDDTRCGCNGTDPGAGLLVLLLLALRRRRKSVPKNMPLGACLLGLITTLPACSDPPALHVAATRELGALQWAPDVQGRDGGYSARVGDRSVWVFGDTGARKGPDALPGYLNNTACSTLDLDASDGLFPLDELRDAGGYPHEFIPLTAEERAYELEHSQDGCGDACEGIALWPGPVLPDPERNRVFVVYGKLLQRPGDLNITGVGSSLAVWSPDLPAYAERPEVAPGSDEPTLLFRAGEVDLAAAAFVEDEFIYAYDCEDGGWGKPCSLARAPLADPLRRDAWQFYTGRGEWSGDPRDAHTLFEGASMMTVHHKPERGLYVAVYATPGGTDVEMRTAPAPEGPWSDPAVMHHPLAPVADSQVYGALFHPELQRGGGDIDYLSYYLGDTGTVQLVEVAWR